MKFFAEKYIQFSENGNSKLIQDLKRMANPGADNFRMKKLAKVGKKAGRW